MVAFDLLVEASGLVVAFALVEASGPVEASGLVEVASGLVVAFGPVVAFALVVASGLVVVAFGHRVVEILVLALEAVLVPVVFEVVPAFLAVVVLVVESTPLVRAILLKSSSS